MKKRDEIADNFKAALKEQNSRKLKFSSSLPELHKMLVRERIKHTMSNELLDWEKVRKDIKLDECDF